MKRRKVSLVLVLEKLLLFHHLCLKWLSFFIIIIIFVAFFSLEWGIESGIYKLPNPQEKRVLQSFC